MDFSTMMRGTAAWLGIKPSPIALAYEVTHLCNLSCDYCDRHTPMPSEMGINEILSVLQQFCDLGLRYVSLDGGEPLAHKHIAEIVDFLKEQNVTVSMNSNGILIPKKIDIIKKLNRLKISLDGPEQNHDAMRGKNAHKRAVNGALAAREIGLEAEFTCVVGQHNQEVIPELIDFVESHNFTIVFQPARNSLFLDTERDGEAFELERDINRNIFSEIEKRKRNGTAVGNKWSSLKHFRAFPADVNIPCAAGWVEVTMDPEGNLFHCGQINRDDKSHNVLTKGVEKTITEMPRSGCKQCWCARVVEGNYAWGGRVDMMIRPMN